MKQTSPVALVVTAATALLLSYWLATGPLVHAAGYRAPYAVLLTTPAFLFYMSAALFFVNTTGYLLLRRISERCSLVAGLAGTLPELFGSVAVQASSSDGNFIAIVRVLDFSTYLGASLYRLLTGIEFSRWATGLTNPSTVRQALEATTVAALNGVIWWVTAAILLRLGQRIRTTTSADDA